MRRDDLLRNLRWRPAWGWILCGALVVLNIILLSIYFVRAADEDRLAAEAVRSLTPSDDAPQVASSAPEPTRTASSPEATKVAAFIGDEFTAGVGASDERKRFSAIVAAKQGWTELNYARAGTGYTVAITDPDAAKRTCGRDRCPAYADMVRTVAARSPDVVVVSGGRADADVSSAKERMEVLYFYSKLRIALPKATIIATSPIWDSSKAPPSLDALAERVKGAVSDVHGKYLDLGQPLAGHPSWLTGDGGSANDRGHAAIARAIEAEL